MTAKRRSAGLERKAPLRGKALFVRLSDEQREAIVRAAARNKNSITDEVLRRVELTLRFQDWEDRLLYASDQASNKEVLIRNKAELIKALTEATAKTLAELAATELPDKADVKAKTEPGQSAGLHRGKKKTTKDTEHHARERTAA
jgi:hypothetical protein